MFSEMKTSILVLASLVVAAPAFAGSAYDGNWSVVIATTSGGCDPAVRYPVAITNGQVVNAGDNPATVQGRVTPRGTVNVNVQSGGQWANGSGRLGMTSGSGVWSGQGSAGPCTGTWAAQRRTGAGFAEEQGPLIASSEATQPGRPIYNYAPQPNYYAQQPNYYEQQPNYNYQPQPNYYAQQPNYYEQQPNYNYQPQPLYNYAPQPLQPLAPQPQSAGSAVAYCQARFHSYDRASGTYLGIDGARHPCP